jgi:hypothetical protein
MIYRSVAFNFFLFFISIHGIDDSYFLPSYRFIGADTFFNELSRIIIEYEKSADSFALLEPGYDLTKISIFKVLENQKNTYISFLIDPQGNKYVVKQERSNSLKKQLQSVCEALAAYMAEKVGVAAHYVRILPIGMEFIGKKITNQTATLHTFVPGVILREIPEEPFFSLHIKLKNDPAEGIPVTRMGLHKKLIARMSFHPALPRMVALDTFLGNRDRNRGNFLYDKKTNMFYAIDMSLIYDTGHGKVLLPQLVCQQMESMVKNKEVFTHKEYEALKIYQETLRALVSYFTPKRIYGLFHKFASDAGLKEGEFFNQKDVFDSIYAYKCKVKETDAYVKKLIDLLSILLKEGAGR